MDKDNLARRLSYIREKSFGLMNNNDSFRSRKLCQEAMVELCNIIEGINIQMEDMSRDAPVSSDSGDGKSKGGGGPDQPKGREHKAMDDPN